MQKYIGTKIISAESCKGYNNRAYNDNDMYPTGALFEEGYKVVYEDGYVSWSPKEVFERCYRIITDSELKLINS